MLPKSKSLILPLFKTLYEAMIAQQKAVIAEYEKTGEAQILNNDKLN
jgi:hypothetical protein